MGLDTEEIRNEIKRILEREGIHRSKRLADEVVKKVGSEKTVYREIKAMAESGVIQRTGSGQHISYDIPSATEKHRLVLFHLLEYAENNWEHLDRSHFKIVNKKQLVPLEALMDIVSGIKQLQTIETRFRIFKMYPALKKSKEWDKLEKQIEKNWKSIRALIAHNIERSGKSDIVGEVLMNFNPIMRGVMTSVDPASDSKHVI
ncbi:hypothetical protein HX860_05190 [Marine Group I thaumarchaeote]|uniref:Uncharacterized protein n=1 Tax=Marine Group I thaumarchaeote TaxID=2511932 RepID=A0A7K4MAC5_9ARCH|nr:MAG: hypothetical protein DSN69_01970 [Nitrosopumilus sp. YT1]NMI82223.1 hypothetical protein [Candidatus Nitrosopumilus sp. MTA1]NWJ20445.1 hypothetical protein [Marine Group I thaumarchaeote]NWJ28309.1 hypothetical protein [Marine Group I thaumarchaeote]NWJ56253.1 hypothetical protein [Marine Group I thaumarchaeote]